MAGVSRITSALQGTLFSQVATIVLMGVSIVSTPLMLKYLDKESYGLSIIFFQLMNYLILMDFGLATAVTRNLALHQGRDVQSQLMMNKIMSSGILVSVGFALLVSGLGLVLAPLVPRLFDLRPELAAVSVPIVISLAMLMGGQFVLRCLSGLFIANHQQLLLAAPTFVVNLLAIMLTLVLLANGVGLWAFVYANLFQLLAGIVVQVALVHIYYPQLRVRPRFFDRQLSRSMLSYGFFMFLYALATQLILHTDRMVIGIVGSLTMVAVFSLTVRIPEVVMLLLSRITENSMAATVEIVTQPDPARNRLYFHRVMVLVMVLSMSGFWLALGFNEWFIRLWVGPEYFAGPLVLVLALVIMVQQTYTRTSAAFLSAKGVVRGLGMMALGEAFLNLGFSISLGHRLGMSGVLLGTILASLLTSSWYVPFLLRKHLGLSVLSTLVRPVLWPVLGVSGVGALLYPLVRLLLSTAGATHWSWFLMAVGGGLAVMTSFVWLVYLRQVLSEYVPKPLRRYLLANSG